MWPSYLLGCFKYGKNVSNNRGQNPNRLSINSSYGKILFNYKGVAWNRLSPDLYNCSSL